MQTVWVRGVAFAAFVGIVGVAVYSAVNARPFGFELSIDGMRHFIVSLGGWGALGVIALMVVHCILPFPSEIVSLSAGLIYGWKTGTVLVWTGAMLGAMVSYGAARALGRPVLSLAVSEAHLGAVDRLTARADLGLLLGVRLLPVISFNLINYAAGFAGIPLWPFAWTTAIGILPLTLYTVWLGERLQSPTFLDWALFGASGLILGALLWEVRRRNWGASTSRFDKSP